LTTCQQCQTEFEPKRPPAKFCSGTCRVAAHRGNPPKRPVRAPAAAQECVTEGARASDTHGASKIASVTLKPPKSLPAGIVRDTVYANVYRLVRPNGTLTDMVNLTRAKDALQSRHGLERAARSA
jgi:hypothetical protein